MNRSLALIGALLALTLGCAACSAGSPGSAPARPPVHATNDSSTHPTPRKTSSPRTTTTPSPVTSPTLRAGDPPPVHGVATGWVSHVDFATVARPDLGCANAKEGGRVEVTKVVSADVTGDGAPDAIVRMDCVHAASEWPDWVLVYSDASGSPKVIARLITATDSTYVPTIAARGATCCCRAVTPHSPLVRRTPRARPATAASTWSSATACPRPAPSTATPAWMR